jgi:hypothetical protein
MSYITLENEYIDLGLKSEKFQNDKNFKLETLLTRFYLPKSPVVALDVARDYLYFLDESYDIKEYKRPKVEKDVREDVNPYKGWYK